MQEYSHVFDSINTLIDTLAQIFLNHRESTIQVMGWSDSWSLSHLGYLYRGTTPVMIKLDHSRSCPWV